MSIRAIYENGIFRPLENVSMKEGTEVKVLPVAEKENGSGLGKSFKDSEAYGIWEDREDIVNSVEYVNRGRQPRWRRPE